MYAGMDAWILTQLFDSILMTSEIGMKSDMKSIVKSVSREYYVTLPIPLNHFRVSTDVPDEIAMAAANKKMDVEGKIDIKMIKNLKKKEKRNQENDSNKNDNNFFENRNEKKENSDDYNVDNNSNSKSKDNDDIIIMLKSLPLKAMLFKEINMSKKWDVPNMYK